MALGAIRVVNGHVGGHPAVAEPGVSLDAMVDAGGGQRVVEAALHVVGKRSVLHRAGDVNLRAASSALPAGVGCRARPSRGSRRGTTPRPDAIGVCRRDSESRPPGSTRCVPIWDPPLGSRREPAQERAGVAHGVGDGRAPTELAPRLAAPVPEQRLGSGASYGPADRKGRAAAPGSPRRRSAAPAEQRGT